MDTGELQQIKIDMALTKVAQKELNAKIDDLSVTLKHLPDNYVRKEVFAPVQAIAFGLVSAIMLGFIGAVIALVLNK